MLNYNGYPAVDLTTFSIFDSFWINGGKGLAEFTNANFLSRDTNFDDNKYAMPVGIPEPGIYTEAVNDPEAGQINVQVKYVLGYVTDQYRSAASPAVRLAAYSYFDFEMQQLANQRVFSLNDRVHREYANFLLPRAVGYSAGLLDYFFRGKIDMLPDPDNAATYVIKNLSNEMMTGAFSLYYDDADDNRHLISNWSLSINANSQSDPVTFKAPISPAQKENDKYILVFQGTMGNESGAVAGKIVSAYTGHRYLYSFGQIADSNSYRLNQRDLDTGNLLWEIDLGYIGFPSSGKAVTDEGIYISGGNALEKRSTSDGSIVWSKPATTAYMAIFVEGGIMYCFPSQLEVELRNSSDGSIISNNYIALTAMQGLLKEVLADSSHFYMVTDSYNNNFTRIVRSIAKIDKANFAVVWTRDFASDNYSAQATIDRSGIYVAYRSAPPVAYYLDVYSLIDGSLISRTDYDSRPLFTFPANSQIAADANGVYGGSYILQKLNEDVYISAFALGGFAKSSATKLWSYPQFPTQNPPNEYYATYNVIIEGSLYTYGELMDTVGASCWPIRLAKINTFSGGSVWNLDFPASIGYCYNYELLQPLRYSQHCPVTFLHIARRDLKVRHIQCLEEHHQALRSRFLS